MFGTANQKYPSAVKFYTKQAKKNELKKTMMSGKKKLTFHFFLKKPKM